MTLGGTKSEKIERQDRQKWAQGTKSEPKGTKSEPKVSQREPKVSQRAPKGSQKWAKFNINLNINDNVAKKSLKMTPHKDFAGPF